MLSKVSLTLARGSFLASRKGFSNVYKCTYSTVNEASQAEPKVGISSPRDVWQGTVYQITHQQEESLREYTTEITKITDSLIAKYPEAADILASHKRAAAISLADRNEPVRVAVTGAAGQIGYALLLRIASGAAFGPTTPVTLQLLELPAAQASLKGVEMELRDCAFPLVKNIVLTDNAEKAFEGVDYALLVGASPRTAGMERGDLLLKNAEIFSTQGKALNKVGKGHNTRVLVVGNPANTNALITQQNAPKIPPENFQAMTRLDHNRGVSQISEKVGVPVTRISQFAIWGNHSATQFPDISHALIDGKPAPDVIHDPEWVEKVFIPAVQNRGAAIIKARGASSAASAASSLIDNIRDWHFGTQGWTSAAVYSNGEYGIQKGLFFSYPITVDSKKKWTIVPDLSISPEARVKIEKTHAELLQERNGVTKYLPN